MINDVPATNGRDIELLRTGGEQALAELYVRYGDRLRRAIQCRLDKRIFRRVDVDDVLQEAYMATARRINEFLDRPLVPAFVWIRQITLQVLIDTHRRHLGAKMRDVNVEVSINDRHDRQFSSFTFFSTLVDESASPINEVAREEMLAELRQAFDEMEIIDREVIAMRHFEGLSNNEVARILDIKKSAASNRYVRAIGRLRNTLSRFDPSAFERFEI